MLRATLFLTATLAGAGVANAQCGHYYPCWGIAPTIDSPENNISVAFAIAEPSIESESLDELMGGIALKASHQGSLYLGGELSYTITNLFANRASLVAAGYYLNDTEAFDWEGKLGKPLQRGYATELVPYIAIGGRSLGDTDITFSHTYAGVGLLSEFQVGRRDARLSLDVGYGKMLRAKAEGVLLGYDIDIDMGEHGVVQAGVGYTVPVTDRHTFVVAADWQSYDYSLDARATLSEWRLSVGGGWRF